MKEEREEKREGGKERKNKEVEGRKEGHMERKRKVWQEQEDSKDGKMADSAL